MFPQPVRTFLVALAAAFVVPAVALIPSYTPDRELKTETRAQQTQPWVAFPALSTVSSDEDAND